MLVLPQHDGELSVRINLITHIEGQRNYSFIHHSNGKKLLTSRTLGSLEELLRERGFFRCHKSYLVNINHIEAYDNNSGISLKKNHILKISRRKIAEFREWYRSYNE